MVDFVRVVGIAAGLLLAWLLPVLVSSAKGHHVFSAIGAVGPPSLLFTAAALFFGPDPDLPSLLAFGAAFSYLVGVVGALLPARPGSRWAVKPEMYEAHYPERSKAKTVRTLGIIGIVIPLVAPFAWIYGVQELRAQRNERRDPRNFGSAQAGMAMGIIGTILWSIVLLAFIYGSGFDTSRMSPVMRPADRAALEAHCQQTAENDQPYRWCAEAAHLAFMNCPAELGFTFVEEMNERGGNPVNVLAAVGCRTDIIPARWSDDDMQAVVDYCLSLGERLPSQQPCHEVAVMLQNQGQSVGKAYCVFTDGPKYNSEECAPYR